jgi:hypothetical protein
MTKPVADVAQVRHYESRDIGPTVGELRCSYELYGDPAFQRAADFLELLDGEVGSLGLYIDELRKSISEAASTERARCVALIPTTWLDPLLTGPTAVVNAPPYGCQDIVRLLNTIRERMETPK